MNEIITASKLIQYFGNRLRQIDQRRLDDGNGNEPNHPMLVVFLGDDALQGYPSVSAKLFQMWPQFESELRFLGIADADGKLSYVALGGGEDANGIEVSFEDVGGMVASLFGLKGHYPDRSRLLIYYVLNTTGFTGETDFEKWVSALAEFKKALALHTIPVSDLLFLMLNENIGAHQRAAAGVRAASEPHIGKEFTAELLLSNFRSDNVIMEDWEDSYRIIADMIALTNNSDSRIAQAMLNARAYTVSYAREEKPAESIGQVIVKKLIDHLSKENFGMVGQLFEEEGTFERLGFTKEGTLEILDRYAEDFLFKMLPTDGQLSLFPRNTDADFEDVSEMSEHEFNALTMNSWQCFLEQLAKQATARIERDLSTRTRWREEYESRILSSFTVNEMIWLLDHMEEFSQRVHEPRELSGTTPVLNAAKIRLKYLLSFDEDILEIFLGVIADAGERAKAFLQSWDRFLQSQFSIHSVKDQNLETFYKRKAVNFLDFNGVSISEEFRRITDMREMESFLYATINRIIESDPSFAAPFEEELESRIQEDAVDMNAKQYLRQKLTGESVPLYFRGTFDYGAPVASAVMLKAGTPLHANLTNNLPPSMYYYDTGCGNAAEAIKVYCVSHDNLLTGTGGGANHEV